MLVCLACYGDRVAALLEGATELRFYGAAADRTPCEARPRRPLEAPLAGPGTCALVARLAEVGAETLICGGLTGCALTALENAGLRVEPWVGGTADEVARAWVAGDLAAMRLPGCTGCGRRRRGGGFGRPPWMTTAKETRMTKNMIAVTSEGPRLTDMVDPRFGRAAGFVVVDLNSGQTSYVDNGASQVLAQGAGIQAAENVARAGAGVVLSGFVGPKAFAALSAAGIAVVQNVEGMTVGQAVEKYKSGQLAAADAPNGGPNAKAGGRR
jgi:predicted Fe-Mo cluster-binding NifX family protein